MFKPRRPVAEGEAFEAMTPKTVLHWENDAQYVMRPDRSIPSHNAITMVDRPLPVVIAYPWIQPDLPPESAFTQDTPFWGSRFIRRSIPEPIQRSSIMAPYTTRSVETSAGHFELRNPIVEIGDMRATLNLPGTIRRARHLRPN